MKHFSQILCYFNFLSFWVKLSEKCIFFSLFWWNNILLIEKLKGKFMYSSGYMWICCCICQSNWCIKSTYNFFILPSLRPSLLFILRFESQDNRKLSVTWKLYKFPRCEEEEGRECLLYPFKPRWRKMEKDTLSNNIGKVSIQDFSFFIYCHLHFHSPFASIRDNM